VRWAVAAVVVTLAAVVAASVLLLRYGGTRNDPVGRLSPIATLPQPAPTRPATTTVPSNRGEGESADD
jgi:hypothetical protein